MANLTSKEILFQHLNRRVYKFFLKYLFLYQGAEGNTFYRTINMDKIHVKNMIFQLQKDGILKHDENLLFTDFGIKYMREKFGFGVVDKALLYKIFNDDIDLEIDFADEIDKLNKIAFKITHSIDIERIYDAESAIERSLTAISKGVGLGDKLLFLGDDVMTCFAFSMLLKKIFPLYHPYLSNIEFVTQNDELLNIVNKMNLTDRYLIFCSKYKIENALPCYFENRFNCIYLSITYSKQSFELYLSRAISCVEDYDDGNIFFSITQNQFDKLDYLKSIINMNLQIEEIYSNTSYGTMKNEYNPNMIEYFSNKLLYLRTTSTSCSKYLPNLNINC